MRTRQFFITSNKFGLFGCAVLVFLDWKHKMCWPKEKIPFNCRQFLLLPHYFFCVHLQCCLILIVFIGEIFRAVVCRWHIVIYLFNWVKYSCANLCRTNFKIALDFFSVCFGRCIHVLCLFTVFLFVYMLANRYNTTKIICLNRDAHANNSFCVADASTNFPPLCLFFRLFFGNFVEKNNIYLSLIWFLFGLFSELCRLHYY